MIKCTGQSPVQPVHPSKQTPTHVPTWWSDARRIYENSVVLNGPQTQWTLWTDGGCSSVLVSPQKAQSLLDLNREQGTNKRPWSHDWEDDHENTACEVLRAGWVWLKQRFLTDRIRTEAQRSTVCSWFFELVLMIIILIDLRAFWF